MSIYEKSLKKLPTVVVVGRINVGKSALFNRLTETTKALVSSVPGTTRDYNLAQAAWQRKIFNLIDTGGINIDILKQSIQALILSEKRTKKILSTNTIEEEIIKQTKAALQKADLILMVTDGQTGLLPEDKELALVLKKFAKPILLVCNKVDNFKWQNQLNDFFKLGLGRPIPVSAINGTGSGDLLDEITKRIKMPRGRLKQTETEPIRVALLGKPNVGKSSLVNKILGEHRVIVSPIPQTTREPQDTAINYQGKEIVLIDTAGLRKKAKIVPGLEKLATRKTNSMVSGADIILLLTEANDPITKQDNYLAGLIKDQKKGIIMIANKWDLISEKDTKIDAKMKKYYQAHFPYLSFAPLVFVSAKTGKNVEKILDLVLFVWQELNKKIEDDKLQEILDKIVQHQKPAQAKGLIRPKIYKLTQTRTNPPEFTLTLGKDQTLHFSYVRFIENQIRDNFGFVGAPIKLKIVNIKKWN